LVEQAAGALRSGDPVGRNRAAHRTLARTADADNPTQFIERRRVEMQWQQSERRFRALIEFGSDIVMLFDSLGTVLYVSPSLEWVLGYAPDEFVGRSGFDLVHPDDLAGSKERFAQALHNPGKLMPAEVRLRHKDKSWRWTDSTTRNLLDEPSVRAVAMNLRDVTARKLAEEALRESERRFRDYAETGSDRFWETGPDHRFTHISVRLTGFPIESASRIGSTRWDFATDVEEEPEKWRQHIATLDARQPFRGFVYRTVLETHTSAAYLSTSGKPIFDAAGNFLGYRGISSDVTAAVRADQAEKALQQARDELAHVARVTTLGELTASIAHEVNQPIGAVVTNADACLQWLGAEPPNLEEARRALGRIINEGNRANQVIRRIHALVRKSPALKDHLDVNDTILEVVALTHSELRRHRISLETRLSRDLPRILGDRVQLHQVILNLIINAIEAISRDCDGPRILEVVSERNSAEGVLVAVRDWGAGLATEQLDRLFDAFYSTKPDGMGMGLAISRSIVEAHGGRLRATHNTPKGAIFQFTLPAIAEGLPSQQTSSSSQPGAALPSRMRSALETSWGHADPRLPKA
jgi:PAS domain S-box-containing protein